MKKTLLSLGLVAISAASFAQINSEADGFKNDFTEFSSNCYAGSVNNGGILVNGNTIVPPANNHYQAVSGLVLTSEASVPVGGSATWFGLPWTNVQADQCQSLFNRPESEGVNSVDMSSNSIIKITAQSNTADAVLEFYLGVGEFSPSSSTYNVGDGTSVIASHTFTSTDEETFEFDLADLEPTIWADWDGKETIQSYGFRSGTANAVFTIKEFNLGTEATVGLFSSAKEASFEVFPNPANGDVVNFSKELNNVSVLNTLGNVVFEANSAKELNVTSLENGVYILKSDEGSTKLIVE